MEFATAKEYRVHLRELIDDPVLVEQAVRAKFPVKSMMIGATEFKAAGKKAPSKSDPWIGSEASDRLARENIELGSQRLLKALWIKHPRILKRLAGQGLQVAHP